MPNNGASEESDYANIAVLVPAVHILCNKALIMQPADIPAPLSCFGPARRGLLKSPLHPWPMALLSPADCCNQCWDLNSAPRELGCFSDALCVRKRPDIWYSCLVWHLGAVCVGISNYVWSISQSLYFRNITGALDWAYSELVFTPFTVH